MEKRRATKKEPERASLMVGKKEQQMVPRMGMRRVPRKVMQTERSKAKLMVE